jgi:hypothetical protein
VLTAPFLVLKDQREIKAILEILVHKELLEPLEALGQKEILVRMDLVHIF